LQDVESLYIGDTEPAVVRRSVSAVTGFIKTMRDCE